MVLLNVDAMLISLVSWVPLEGEQRTHPECQPRYKKIGISLSEYVKVEITFASIE